MFTIWGSIFGVHITASLWTTPVAGIYASWSWSTALCRGTQFLKPPKMVGTGLPFMFLFHPIKWSVLNL